MRHGLAELDFFIWILDEVGLVDDVDEMARFGHPPEDVINAKAQFPLLIFNLTNKQEICLAQIAVAAFRVAAVVSIEAL